MIYAAPTLVTSGNVVRETLNGTNPLKSENSGAIYVRPVAGSLGFGL